MINIDELRQRVEAAEQRFGVVDSAQRQSSEKLIAMMNAIEQDQAQRQIALEENKALVASMALENQQLRGMLHSLLLATEAAGNVANVDIMRQIGSKLAAIVEAAAPAEASEAYEASEAAETPEISEPSESAEILTVETAEDSEFAEATLEVAETLEAAADETETFEASEASEAFETSEVTEAVVVEPVEAVEADEDTEADEPEIEAVADEPAVDDDILPEPPGMLPSAVMATDTDTDTDTDMVVSATAEENAPDATPEDDAGSDAGDETANREAPATKVSNGATGKSKIDAAEAANGVREILLRMNKEKRQQEAAARPPSCAIWCP